MLLWYLIFLLLSIQSAPGPLVKVAKGMEAGISTLIQPLNILGPLESTIDHFWLMCYQASCLSFKGLVACCHSFCLFYLFFIHYNYMAAIGYTVQCMTKLMVDDL
jgi:hypothetical protein